MKNDGDDPAMEYDREFCQDSESEQIRKLWLPAYIPGIIYQAAIAATIPVIPYVAVNNLGMSTAGVLWLFLLSSVCLVIGSGPAGIFINWVGEPIAMVISSLVIGIATVDIILVLMSGSRSSTAQSFFIVGMLVIFMAEDVWSVARSTFVADSVSFEVTGKAMSIYGITMRLGRVIGPGLGAIVLKFWGRIAVFVLVIILGALATVIVLACEVSRRKKQQQGKLRKVLRSSSEIHRASSSLIVLAAVGNIAISFIRNNRESLFALWLHHLHFTDSVTSSIFCGILFVEVLSFFPASSIMQRLGRFRTAGISAIIIGIGFFLVAIFPHRLGLFIAGAVLLGVGNGIGSGVIKTMGSDLSPSVGRAKFMGWWNSISNVGILAGALVSVFVGRESIPLALCVTGAVGISGGSWMCFWALLGKDSHRRHMDAAGAAGDTGTTDAPDATGATDTTDATDATDATGATGVSENIMKFPDC